MSDPQDKQDPERGGESVPVKVVDRRFWARPQGAEEAPEGGEGRRSAYPTMVEELQQRLEEAQAREREILLSFSRAQRENEAFRQRLERDVERRLTLVKAELFRGLLEVADNLERALAASGAGAAAGELARGVGQVLGQLKRLLASQGVEEVQVSGLPFDPAVAEAVEAREVPEADLDGVVVEVAQRGYRYAGQTLRPARVAVGRRPAKPAEAGQAAAPADAIGDPPPPGAERTGEER